MTNEEAIWVLMEYCVSRMAERTDDMIMSELRCIHEGQLGPLPDMEVRDNDPR